MYFVILLGRCILLKLNNVAHFLKLLKDLIVYTRYIYCMSIAQWKDSEYQYWYWRVYIILFWQGNPESRQEIPETIYSATLPLGYKNTLNVKSVRAHILSPNFKGIPVGPSL